LRRRKRGFTLIEVMMTVAILSVLSLGVMSIQGRGRDTQFFRDAEAQMDVLENSLRQAYAYNGYSFSGTVTATSGTALGSAFPAGFETALNRFLNRSADNIRDPWGNSVLVASNLDAAGTTGILVVFVDGGTGAANAEVRRNVPGGRLTVGHPRRNSVYGNAPMWRIIVCN
jgi:prepilin-type N-terminal cleavage/methylation domain-containing protein